MGAPGGHGGRRGRITLSEICVCAYRGDEECEQDRAKDTRDAIKASRKIDEHTDAITTLKTEIKDLTSQIAEANAEVAAIVKDLAQAQVDRDAEKVEYESSKADDEAAVATVADATNVLKSFYSDNDLNFVQQPAVSNAGAAPPPPPSTWDAPYAEKTAESTGVIAILEMVTADIKKDIAKALDSENAAIATFTKVKTDLNKEKDDLNTQISTWGGTKGDKEQELSDGKGDRRTEKEGLDIVLQKIKDAESGCNYFTINYDVRRTNRQVEMDGLKKAKAILNGAAFGSA